jgi:hypothetical protein
MKNLFILLAITFSPLAAYGSEAECFSAGRGCADVDIDAGRAAEAYQHGCDAGDAYACARLGQFFEVKQGNREKAVALYDRACKAHDAFGCEQGTELHVDLCFLEGRKKYCGGAKPTGEVRMLMYLRTLDSRYSDALRTHNFDYPWKYKQAQELFDKRVKEKNPVLLKALEKELSSKRHDGADAEGLKFQIECMKKKCPEYDDQSYD